MATAHRRVATRRSMDHPVSSGRKNINNVPCRDAQGCAPCSQAYLPYCSSLTFSIQSTLLPSSASAIAMWVIAVLAVAPCQCFSPAGNQTSRPQGFPLLGHPHFAPIRNPT